MNVAQILEQVQADGITLTLSPPGVINVAGDQLAVDRWLPTIREHKPPLMALLAANEEELDEAVREATEERAAIFEHDGGIQRPQAEAVADLARAFYAHLMGVGKVANCCHAPVSRYCPEGLRLRDIYFRACS